MQNEERERSMDDNWVRVKQAAIYFDVSQKIILDMIKDGKLESKEDLEPKNFRGGKYPVLVRLDSFNQSKKKFNQNSLTNEQNASNNKVSISPKETYKPIAIIEEFSHPAWDNARLIDRERALAKFDIVKEYIIDKYEQKAKGISITQSGKSFVTKLINGLVCLESFNKLRRRHIALPTIYKWVKALRESGDMDSPIGMLEEYKNCGRRSKIDKNLLNDIRK